MIDEGRNAFTAFGHTRPPNRDAVYNRDH